MFIISYLFIVIGDSRLLSFKKLSFPPPLWLSYTFSSFYFKHKTFRGDGTYAGIHTNVRNICNETVKSIFLCCCLVENNQKVSSPKNENSVINYSPSCLSKPIRPSFIFATQIKIFLMKSESSQTLHRQQGSYHGQGPET